jgi:hypothetical protein
MTGRKTLKEVYGSPLYGLKTGLNEAFVLTRKQRDDLVKAQPKSAILFKPFLRGEDLKKWRTESQDLWLLLFKRGQTRELMGRQDGVNEAEAWQWLKAEYPPIAAWLKAFEAAAKKRTDQGEYWWELRACSYYTKFDAPKIVYLDMADKPNFSLDTSQAVLANTAYFISNADATLQAIISSRVLWYLVTGMTTILRGGFFRLFTQHVATLPIPDAEPHQKKELEKLTNQAQTAAEARRDIVKRFGLMVLRDFARAKSKQPSATLPGAMQQAIPTFDEFTAVLKERFKRELNLSEKSDWQADLDTARAAVAQHTDTITACEQAIDQIVYGLFDLSAAEVALIENKAEVL